MGLKEHESELSRNIVPVNPIWMGLKEHESKLSRNIVPVNPIWMGLKEHESELSRNSPDPLQQCIGAAARQS
jgi:hypothetical protein